MKKAEEALRSPDLKRFLPSRGETRMRVLAVVFAGLALPGCVSANSEKIKWTSVTPPVLAAPDPINTAALARPQITKQRTSQPIGHANFCKQLPEECDVQSEKTERPVITITKWGELVEVNNEVQAKITPASDLAAFGVEEHWTYPESLGDCEDYVLLKRWMLLQKGWPPSSLLITVVEQTDGEGHAVLVVRGQMPSGQPVNYVLDNLAGGITEMHKVPYFYKKIQSPNHTGQWNTIADKRTKDEIQQLKDLREVGERV